MILDDIFFNQIEEQAKSNPRLRQNYNLHETLDAKAQRLINVVLPGTVFQIHRHPNTNATTFCIRGKVDQIFYDDEGNEIKRFHLDPKQGNYGVQIPKGQWHGMEVIEPSVLFEVKDGPYEPLSDLNIL